MRLLPLALGAALLVVPSAAAVAQTPTPRSERPYRGLFGNGLADLAQSLIVSADVGGGYDDDLLAEARGLSGGTATNAPQAGVLGRASGRVAYALDTSHVTASASGSAMTRFYGSSRELRTVFGSATVALAPVTIRRNTTMTAGASTVVQPYNLQSVFPVLFQPQLLEEAAPDDVRGTTSHHYVAEMANAGVSHQFSRRNRLAVRYNFRNSQVPSGQGSLMYQDIGGALTHTLAKGLDLRLGYGYRVAEYPSFASSTGDPIPATTVPSQTIDAGVDFNRALSISRRTTLSFGTGSTAYRARGSYQFRATGTATLNRELGRSWGALASYSRRVVFEEQWQQPVLLDAASGGISGLLTRRIQLASSVGIAHGALTDGKSGTFESYFGITSMRVGISRFASFDLLYSYYQHRYAQQIVIPSGLPNTMRRQSLRATVTMWAPLMRRARRPDAPR